VIVNIYRVLFEDVVGQRCSAGLVSGEGFAVDGSLIGSNAGRTQRVESVSAIREGEASPLKSNGRESLLWGCSLSSQSTAGAT
jgi:hypothetical protein